MVSVVLALVLSALLVGLANTLNLQSKSRKRHPAGELTLTFFTAALNSLIASCLIPVALGALGPSVLKEVSNDWTRGFVFFGLCLAAGLSGERFSTAIGRKLVNDMEGMQKGRKALEEALSEPEEAGSPLAMSEVEDATCAEVLHALGTSPYPLRSLDGLARNVSIDREALSNALIQLEEQGKVGKITLDGGRVRWHLRP